MTAKVSVCLITYNHERFIAQCVEAALMQETDEPFEIIIGEDCSTDHTREVLLQIKERHPERIRMLLRTCRVGGRRNFLETLRACEGEYIAFLDGDDYWTSRRKLQRQVDLLDGRPDVALCGHGYEIRHEDCDGAEQGDLFGPLQERWLTLEDFFWGSWLRHSTVMVRRKLLEALPERFGSVILPDLGLQFLCLQHGVIGYLDQSMAVYRIHDGGIWSKRRIEDKLQLVRETYRQFRAHVAPEYHSLIDEAINGFTAQQPPLAPRDPPPANANANDVGHDRVPDGL